MKKCMSIIEGLGVGIFIALMILPFSIVFFLYIFGSLFYTVGKEIHRDWRRGNINEAREEIILFLIVWGPFFFTLLYILFDR